MLNKTFSNQNGFTYLAALFAVFVVSLSLTVTGTVWEKVGQRDKEEELLFRGESYMKAIEEYKKFRGVYPKKLKQLLGERTTGGIRRYIRKLYDDPMTKSGKWAVIKNEQGFIVGVKSSSVENVIKTADFPEHLKHFEGIAQYSGWEFKVKEGPVDKVQSKSNK